eukprot:TRINITY_DN21575_c0_g1_i1.p1 TRINITY_DN21575_c0_g1~~TRINITY_DN21575_c0_g1_i1.p1  ORF type:complete len:232 (+),score=52.56 TRINITY_DN21575_c0_g1_i1:174-869(+)
MAMIKREVERQQEDFESLRRDVEQKFRNIPSLEGDARQREIRNAEIDLGELDEIVRSMNWTVRGSSFPDQNLVSKVKNYESEVAKLRTELRRAITAFRDATTREALFGGLKGEAMSASSMEQRERMIATTQKMQKSNDILQGCIQEMAANEKLVIEVIMPELERNGDQLRGILPKMQGINGSLSRSGKVMNSIGRRLMTNKIVMGLIILALIFGIVIVIYFKWFWKSSSQS